MKQTGNIMALCALLFLSSCHSTADSIGSAVSVNGMQEMNNGLVDQKVDDSYRNTYEIFVGSFYDSDGDGTGDLNGVRKKLDYIEDLGFNAIWLMPVSPSPTYHKYDITDYMAIDPAYGTMADYEQLLKECQEKGIRVYMDLVLNHTSIQHPWFVQAKEYLESLGPDEAADETVCPYVNYYNFTKEAQAGYAQLDNGWYYEARFWEGMPDLNLANDNVKKEIEDILRFWLDKGVNGFRLDAVTYYFNGDDGQNIAFLSWLKKTASAISEDCYFVCEAWTTQAAYASYYQSGIDSMFDFAFADSKGIIASVLKDSISAAGYGKAMEKEEQLYASYSDAYINAPFYTNHDMGRSAGYYSGDDGTKTKTAIALNLLMSGNAFLYYGEEIGMKGAGKDENKRAPMYWSAAENAGMCDGPPEMDNVEMKFAALDEQINDLDSIYSYTKEALKIRNAFPCIARGTTTVNEALSNDKVCVFDKTDASGNHVTIAINLGEEKTEIKIADQSLKAVLLTGEEPCTYQNGTLTLPAYGIAFLQ